MNEVDTKILKIDPDRIDNSKIDEAAGAILEGKTVVMPTETVYGLGANAFSKEAVAKIFIAKGRPSDNPLICHISNRDMLSDIVAEVPQSAKILMDHFWGGPLTIIFKKKDNVPDIVSAGLPTVAVRMPSHPVANALIEKAGVPVAAPSANLSGTPSPTTAQHVIDDLYGRVDVIIDGGNSEIGIESTVIDLTGEIPMILRPGYVTINDVRKLLGKCEYGNSKGEAGTPKSPGMKYTHYAPKTPVVCVIGSARELELFLMKENRKIAVIAQNANKYDFNADVVLSAGFDVESYAARLFYLLRKTDELDVELTYALLPTSKSGLEVAVANRLLKASGGRLINLKNKWSNI